MDANGDRRAVRTRPAAHELTLSWRDGHEGTISTDARETVPDAAERPGSRSVSAPEGGERTLRGSGRRSGRRWDPSRTLVRLGSCTAIPICAATLVAASGIARAHGTLGHGGTPVTFAVVVGLPIVAGLGGGAAAVRYLGTERTNTAGHRASIALGLLLVVLGVTFAITAGTKSLSLGIAGGAVGVLSVLWAARRDGTATRGRHAELTLGAVSVHRLLEGVALGTLYTSGVAVGLLGAVALAGHTALETAAVGGLNESSRLRAAGAIVIVQVGYAIGAVVGIGVAGTVPVWVEIGAVALAGGVLLGIGVIETGHSVVAGRLRAPVTRS